MMRDCNPEFWLYYTKIPAARIKPCCLPVYDRQLLIKHRILLTRGLTHRLKLGFGRFEIGIDFRFIGNSHFITREFSRKAYFRA
jgi:hypothetical protein